MRHPSSLSLPAHTATTITAVVGVVLCCLALFPIQPSSAFFFSTSPSSSDSSSSSSPTNSGNEQINVLESTPGVSIVYPNAIGPQFESQRSTQLTKGDELEVAAIDGAAATTAATTPEVEYESESKVETTTAPVDTTTTEVDSTNGASTEPTTTTITTESGAATTTTEVPSTTEQIFLRKPLEPSATENRHWHFNNQGVNSQSIWFDRNNRPDSNDAVESSPSAVYATRVKPTPSPVHVLHNTPNSAPARSESQIFTRRVLTAPAVSNAHQQPDQPLVSSGPAADAATAAAFGEYARARNDERNLYYPDISRIQSSSSQENVASSSSAAALTESAASSNSITSVYGGVKGGAQYRSQWDSKVVHHQSPVKAIRKVVYKSGKSERLQTSTEQLAQSPPVRVRVVVQPQIQQIEQQQYLGRLQNENSASSASSSSFFTKKVSNEYQRNQQQFFSKINNNGASQNEFVQIGKIREEQGTKSIPLPRPAPIKSIPVPVVVSVKSPPPPPRPAPIRSAVKTVVRAPVFEQQSYEKEDIHENPEPEPYSFNFNVNDDSGNGQFRREEGDANGVVRGSYGYSDAWGLYRIVDYVADANGFRASIRTNEPGLVERNPVTNQVENPAHIKVAAEDTPSKVVELMRLVRPQPQF